MTKSHEIESAWIAYRRDQEDRLSRREAEMDQMWDEDCIVPCRCCGKLLPGGSIPPHGVWSGRDE